MWEDEANANGGKWVLTMKNNPQLLDRSWNWLAMALVGEELEEGDEICGAVVSLRTKVDRIQVWTRSKDEVEKLNSIGKKLVKLLDISEADSIGLEFQVCSIQLVPLDQCCSLQISTTPTIALFPTSSCPFSLCPPRLIAPPFRHRQAAGTVPPGPLEGTNYPSLLQQVAPVLLGNLARALEAEHGRVRSVHET